MGDQEIVYDFTKLMSMVRYDEPTVVLPLPESTEDIPGAIKEALTAGTKQINQKQIEDILNAIIPPRHWEENGIQWRQAISSQPATRAEIVGLQETLDMRLQQTQARETGICPIRREFYSQVMDELIRQTTLNCAERGLIMLRVRDELQLTLEAYETLYTSSLTFGMRKALTAQEEKDILRERVKSLEDRKANLEETITDMKYNAELTAQRNLEIYEAEQRRFNREITFLERTNKQLQNQLNAITKHDKKTKH